MSDDPVDRFFERAAALGRWGFTVPYAPALHAFRYLGVLWVAHYAEGSVVRATAIGITRNHALTRAYRKATK